MEIPRPINSVLMRFNFNLLSNICILLMFILTGQPILLWGATILLTEVVVLDFLFEQIVCHLGVKQLFVFKLTHGLQIFKWLALLSWMVNPAQHYLCRSLLFNGYSDFL
jgi:hypothetical protein